VPDLSDQLQDHGSTKTHNKKKWKKRPSPEDDRLFAHLEASTYVIDDAESIEIAKERHRPHKTPRSTTFTSFFTNFFRSQTSPVLAVPSDEPLVS
jgi:hypothetical protein